MFENVEILSDELLEAHPLQEASAANKECQRNFEYIPTGHDRESPFFSSINLLPSRGGSSLHDVAGRMLGIE
jgi:hypothetical protein